MTTLTKRMAEDLTQYYQELGVRVRYLHSDIETLERVEILRDLRRGEFDVLVGINLLREGLDLPGGVAGGDSRRGQGRVPAIGGLADPDVRARRAQRQRPRDHVRRQGRPTRCGPRCPKPRRRRAIQEAYNQEHGITPQSIIKQIDDVMSSVYERDYMTPATTLTDGTEQFKTQAELDEHIAALRDEMKAAAANLDFEKAAALRDTIKRLRNPELQLPRAARRA